MSYLLVFSVVFGLVFDAEMPRYGLFVVVGLVAWQFFSQSILAGSASVTSNAALVEKIWFPREVLPVSAVLTNACHGALQAMLVIAALAAFGHAPAWGMLPLAGFALVNVAVWACAASLWLSALTVRIKDTRHAVEAAMMFGFWASAIVYPVERLTSVLGAWAPVVWANPALVSVTTLQRVLYNPTTPGIVPMGGWDFYAPILVASFAAGLVACWAASRYFAKHEGDFGELL